MINVIILLVSPALRSWWGLKLYVFLNQGIYWNCITGSSELVGIETRRHISHGRSCCCITGSSELVGIETKFISEHERLPFSITGSSELVGIETTQTDARARRQSLARYHRLFGAGGD